MRQEAAYYGIPKDRPVTRPINQPPEEAEPEDTGPKYYEEPSQPADSYAKFHPTDKNFRNAPQQVWPLRLFRAACTWTTRNLPSLLLAGQSFGPHVTSCSCASAHYVKFCNACSHFQSALTLVRSDGL